MLHVSGLAQPISFLRAFDLFLDDADVEFPVMVGVGNEEMSHEGVETAVVSSARLRDAEINEARTKGGIGGIKNQKDVASASSHHRALGHHVVGRELQGNFAIADRKGSNVFGVEDGGERLTLFPGELCGRRRHSVGIGID